MKSRRWTFRILFAAGLIGAIVVAAAIYQTTEKRAELPNGLIQANGRIEGDSVIVANEHAGRIIELPAKEGDVLQKGTTLARLDDRITRTRVAQATAAAAAAKAQAERAQADLALLTKEVPLQIAAAIAGVDAASTQLLKARQQEQQAHRDYKRYLKLARDGWTSQSYAEKARTQWQQAKDEVIIAQALLNKANQDKSVAQLGSQRIESMRAQVTAFRAMNAQAIAQASEAQTVLDELTIKSLTSGTITNRFAQLGEVASAGTPLFELVDLDALYLKVFIPEAQIGKVRRGLAAQIHTDAFPDQPFDAEVRYIASRAQFTPKEIQTPDERVKLVYAVKLYVRQNPEHRLTPGLPADAIIRWLPQVAWVKPQW